MADILNTSFIGKSLNLLNNNSNQVEDWLKMMKIISPIIIAKQMMYGIRCSCYTDKLRFGDTVFTQAIEAINIKATLAVSDISALNNINVDLKRNYNLINNYKLRFYTDISI